MQGATVEVKSPVRSYRKVSRDLMVNWPTVVRVGMELVKPEEVRGIFCRAVGVGQVSCCSPGHCVAGGKKKKKQLGLTIDSFTHSFKTKTSRVLCVWREFVRFKF